MTSHTIAIRASLALLSLSMMLIVPQQADGRGRDPDGSRMQARRIKLGASARDTLKPPRDRVDWRYFKLERSKVVQIKASAKDNLRLKLTSATGRSAGSAAGKSATLRKRLAPGLYYLSVSSSKATSYSISVR